MLDFPDQFNEFDRQIQSQINFEKIDAMDLDTNVDYEKLQRQQISKILRKFIKSYTLNGNFEKQREDIKKYAIDYLNKEYPISSQTAMNIVMGMIHTQFSNIFINIPLQAFVLYVELIKCSYTYIHETYIQKKEKSDAVLLDCHFIAYSLELLSGLNVLLSTDNYNNVISVYRTFYENFIIFSFIHEHPELINDFLQHKKITEIKLQMEISELNNIPVAESLKNSYDEIINNYDESFIESYGWASKVLEKNKRNLKTMYESSSLEEPFNLFYKLSCKYSHSTAFSLFNRPDFHEIRNFLYGILHITSKEFEILITEVKMTQKDKVLLSEWINAAGTNLKKVLDGWRNVKM